MGTRMTDLEIRQVIAEALSYASVPQFDGSPAAAAFMAGISDIKLADLEIDSLAAMELCIAIESSVGVSVVPADLVEIGSLGKLSAKVRATLEAGAEHP